VLLDGLLDVDDVPSEQVEDSTAQLQAFAVLEALSGAPEKDCRFASAQ
jgi:hypothetical protein